MRQLAAICLVLIAGGMGELAPSASAEDPSEVSDPVAVSVQACLNNLELGPHSPRSPEAKQALAKLDKADWGGGPPQLSPAQLIEVQEAARRLHTLWTANRYAAHEERFWATFAYMAYSVLHPVALSPDEQTRLAGQHNAILDIVRETFAEFLANEYLKEHERERAAARLALGATDFEHFLASPYYRFNQRPLPPELFRKCMHRLKEIPPPLLASHKRMLLLLPDDSGDREQKVITLADGLAVMLCRQLSTDMLAYHIGMANDQFLESQGQGAQNRTHTPYFPLGAYSQYGTRYSSSALGTGILFKVQPQE